MNNKACKYFVYARKSSESEDRQMASIGAQIDELKKVAAQENIQIVEILTEAKSAKAPGREVYSDMIARIKNGEADGILCWKLNRLARNPIDGGEISWLLQKGVIQHILTVGRSYHPSDNVLMMAVELGMANQFVKDLSTDVKRGLKKKAEMGWYPGQALLGYKNTPDREKGFKTVEVDEERFDTVRKMFDMVLSCEHSAAKVLKIATEEWGLRRPNGKPLSSSTWYKMLSHPFYYGRFEFNGAWYDGRHQPMITREEYEQIQTILGKKDKSKPHRHEFPFTGLMKCGECGKTITAEHRYKKLKSGKVLHYVHYHCTSPNKSVCSQGVTHQKELEEQFSELVRSVEVPHDFVKWALTIVQERNKEESASRTQILAKQRKLYDDCAAEIDNLIDMRANGELTAEEFAHSKEKLGMEKERLHNIINNVDERLDT